MANALARVIEERNFIDRVADPIQAPLARVLERRPELAEALHGQWLGHPLHAQLTDLPIGAWVAGQVLDVIELRGGSHKLRPGADAVHAIGLVTALGAAVAGLADWTTTNGGAKRVGFVHGSLNMVIAGLYGGSILARARRRRRLGIALSSTGFALAVVSAWLGGELAYRHGVGVKGRHPVDEVPRHVPPAPAEPEEAVRAA